MYNLCARRYSYLGLIGKLFRTVDLPLLTQFMLGFYKVCQFSSLFFSSLRTNYYSSKFIWF